MSKLTTLALAVALSATAGIACADSGDNSMNPFTGESWAALQGGGRNLGLGEPRGDVTIAKSKADRDAANAAPATKEAEKAHRRIDYGHYGPDVDTGDAT
jgi:hypothetical protein